MKQTNLICILCAVFLAEAAVAQNVPHIGYAYPAGGQTGTVFKVRVGGQYLEKVHSARVSGRGIDVKIVEYIEPIWKIRNRLELKLADKAGTTNRPAAKAEKDMTPDEKSARREMMEELKSQLPPLDPRIKKIGAKKQKNVQLDEVIVLEVMVSPEAELGRRELRLQSPGGISNPMVFQVGDLPEVSEDNDSYAAQVSLPEMPVLMNGQMLPGEVKTFVFNAKKGQDLIFAVQARALIPYLADAVPGWFQAVLTLYDSKDKKLAMVDDNMFDPDPVMFFSVPADGEYKLELRDSIYRGREDFVYRLSCGQLPYITSIFPLGGPIRSTTTVSAAGVNLPVNVLSVASGNDSNTAIPVSLANKGIRSNRLMFEVDDMPEASENEPNDKSAKAQKVGVPCVVNGRIDKPGDIDMFTLSGSRGDMIIAEITARRLGSPLDSCIAIVDDSGNVLAASDDHEDKGAGLTTHQADSYIHYKLASDGKYFVTVKDAQGKSGAAYSYRLRVSRPEPDFSLRIVPSAFSIQMNGSVPVTVYAVRKDGFSGKIDLKMDNVPDGFIINPSFIPENADKARVMISNGGQFKPALQYPVVTGSADAGGKVITRKAVPAEDMMQAFGYRHLVQADELLMNVTKGWALTMKIDLPEGKPLQIPCGGSVTVKIRADSKKQFNGKSKLVLDDPPKGISMDEITPPSGAKDAELVFRSDDDDVKPGASGTLILNNVVNQRVSGVAAAVAFEVTARETGTSVNK